MEDLYQELILDAATDTTYRGTLPAADLTWHERNASCGDEVWITLKLDKRRHLVTQLQWEGEGCIISRAAMAMVAERINQQQLSIHEASQLQLADVLDWLQLPDISPGRLKCVMLGIEALKKALSTL